MAKDEPASRMKRKLYEKELRNCRSSFAIFSDG